jgi:hypothetical protein
LNNKQQKIKGYRDLSQEEINSMNKAKDLASQVGTLVDELLDSQETDKRWANIAKTDLQKGFMSLIRSIAQPTTF